MLVEFEFDEFVELEVMFFIPKYPKIGIPTNTAVKGFASRGRVLKFKF